MDEETKRQMLHVIVGLAAVLFLLYFGRGISVAAAFFILIIGSVLINARLLGKKIILVQWFEKHFERADVMFPGWGSACYAAGVLIPLTFLIDMPEIISIIFILAIGDAVSTAVGRKGILKLPYNKKKTLEGTFAFFLACLPAYYFIGFSIIPLAILATIVESIDFRIDDNLTIPIAGTILFLVV